MRLLGKRALVLVSAFLVLSKILTPCEVMGFAMLFFAMLTLWLDDKPSEEDKPLSAKPVLQSTSFS